MAFVRILLCLAAAWLAPRAGAAAENASPTAAPLPDLVALAALVDQDELSAVDIAKATLLATRFFATGPSALPRVEACFRDARTPGQASLSGLHLAIHGSQEHLDLIRGELERNRLKRPWLKDMFGSESLFMESLEQGRAWQPLLRTLPSVGGCRTLTRQLAASRDALVRRAGLYWGYWVADDAYWTSVRRLSGKDPDPLTRRIAARLLALSPPGE
jgi:hypothetical protein